MFSHGNLVELHVYAPVAEDTSFKTLCVVAAAENLDLHQYDVNQAFLAAKMDQDVYIEITNGWDTSHLDSNIQCVRAQVR